MKKLLIALLLLTIFTASCATTETPVPTPGITLAGTLRPYPSDTPTPTLIPTDYVSPSPVPSATATPTPIYYSVQEKDDMYGIAFRFGISPEVLMTANPTVNPRFMGVGTLLLIPITPQVETESTPTPALTPTPAYPFSKLHDPVCYPDGSGGLYCFILVENNTDQAFENVSGTITLFDEESNTNLSEFAIMPLNILPVQTSLPMIAHFAAPVPEAYSLEFSVDVVLPVPDNDTRYTDAVIDSKSITVSQDGRSATISGQLSLADEQASAESIWILAVAYDGDGQVVGLRRWEAQAALKPAEKQSFQMTLYSLGQAIEQVELITEARPRTQ